MSINFYITILLIFTFFLELNYSSEYLLNDENNSQFNEENTSENSNNFMIIILEFIKTHPDEIKSFLEVMPPDTFANFLKPYFISEEDCLFLNKTLKDLIDNKEEDLYPLIDIINKNTSIIDYFIDLIKINSMNTNETLGHKLYYSIKKVHLLNKYHVEFFNYILNITKKYPDLFFFVNILKKALNNDKIDSNSLINFFKEKFEPIVSSLFFLKN